METWVQTVSGNWSPKIIMAIVEAVIEKLFSSTAIFADSRSEWFSSDDNSNQM